MSTPYYFYKIIFTMYPTEHRQIPRAKEVCAAVETWRAFKDLA